METEREREEKGERKDGERKRKSKRESLLVHTCYSDHKYSQMLSDCYPIDKHSQMLFGSRVTTGTHTLYGFLCTHMLSSLQIHNCVIRFTNTHTCPPVKATLGLGIDFDGRAVDHD